MDGAPGTSHGPGMDDGPAMDARAAAGIMRQAQEHASSELTVNRPLLLGCAGLVYLLAYGTVWLAVRGQRPYQGPPGWALGMLAGLALIAVIVTTAIVNRAVSGVGGESRRSRRAAFLAPDRQQEQPRGGDQAQQDRPGRPQCAAYGPQHG